MQQPLLQTQTRKIYTVSEVTRDIRGLLEDNFPTLWLSGEISNFKAAASGHMYFTLKDAGAQMSGVMFRGSSNNLKFDLEDGLEVIVHGRITLYEPRGQYQIIVDHAEPKGLGALQLAFEQLKKKLTTEGLFKDEFKKEIPYLPKKVGIITSSKGAALHDMVTILTRRFPNIEILINPVRVQGDGAAEEVAQAISEMNERSDIDVLLVGRGGGSLEDLWAFNEEVVVRAVFESAIPIISAVGHETDFTLSDLVADLRAPTPSAAAELAVPEKGELVYTLQQHSAGLTYATRQFLKSFREKINFLKRQIKDPRRVLEDWKIRIDDFRGRITQGVRQSLLTKRHHLKELVLSLPNPQQKLRELKIHLQGLSRNLESLSPRAPLKRGYSITFKEGSSKPLRSAFDAKPSELLNIQLHEGSLKVKVVG